MKNLILILLLLNGVFVTGFTQELYNYETKGDRFYFSYSYDKAIIKYKLAKNLSLPAQRKLADSYQQTYQPVEAEKVYLGILNATEGLLPEDYYNYAMACRINRKYNEADKWMQKFALEQPLDLRAIDYKLNSNKLRGLINDSTEFSIQNLAMNSAALDFGTSYYKNGIVFSSSRSNADSRKKKYNWTGKPFWEMYVSENSDSNLINPIPFDESLKSKLNDGPASFSNDGTFIAFTRNQTNNKRKDKTIELEIFFSSYQNGSWTEPIPFYLNNINYSVGHPSLTQDGNTMFFASDMPGGFGKADIYSINRNVNGEWGTPTNLGNAINTEGDDMFPFITENERIFYFSSEGHFGLGGLDIFSSSISPSGFSKITNLGSPINSSNNDYGFIMNSNTRTGFFSSDRIGGKGGDDIYALSIADMEIEFEVFPPIKKDIQQRIREFFPIRNYVFFDPNQTAISDRYSLLRKDQVQQFVEEQLSENTDKDLATRAKRQMLVYYNLLNILGARMKENPSATITLVGSSDKGPSESLIRANSIKSYLTNIFQIDAAHIYVEGRIKPEVPSEQPGGKIDLKLLQEGDRRVTIESSYPSLLKEFEIESNRSNKLSTKQVLTQANSNAFLFSVSTKKLIDSWSFQITDNANNLKKFGPYQQKQVYILPDSILGTIANNGNYKVQMIGLTKNGFEFIRNAEFNIAPSLTKTISDILRFSIIFEFDDAKSIEIYKQFLTETVTPKIPYGATVVLNGYTDIIGQDDHNNDLSLRRMKSVKQVIEDLLYKAGRNDVVFDEHWHGGNTVTFPFANKLPEERFYNRTVFIDIIPKN